MHAVIVALLASLPAPPPSVDGLPDIALSDVEFFAAHTRERVRECWRLAHNHKETVRQQIPLGYLEAQAWEVRKEQADYCYRAWDLLDDVQFFLNQHRPECDGQAMEALHKLRHFIGPEMFYAGLMPDPVPAWHLPRID